MSLFALVTNSIATSSLLAPVQACVDIGPCNSMPTKIIYHISAVARHIHSNDKCIASTKDTIPTMEAQTQRLQWVMRPQDMLVLHRPCLVLFAVSATSSAARACQTVLLTIAGERISRRLRQRLFAALTRQDQ